MKYSWTSIDFASSCVTFQMNCKSETFDSSPGNTLTSKTGILTLSKFRGLIFPRKFLCGINWSKKIVPLLIICRSGTFRISLENQIYTFPCWVVSLMKGFGGTRLKLVELFAFFLACSFAKAVCQSNAFWSSTYCFCSGVIFSVIFNSPAGSLIS